MEDKAVDEEKVLEDLRKTGEFPDLGHPGK